MGSLGRCLARSLPRGQPGLSPAAPRCYGSGEDAAAGQAGRGAAAPARGHHPALRAPRLQAGGHEAAPGRPEARGAALRAAAAEALLPRARRLHDLGAGGGHGMGGLQRGAVHSGHGWGQQRRGDNPRGLQRAHHQERGPCQRLHRDGPEGDRLLVPAGRAGGLGQQRQGQHLRALGPRPGHPKPQ